MHRDDLEELHYITPINNIPSILRYGILSNRRADRLEHETVALQEVQERRENKRLPTDRWLHDYVNLYICARNPMMYRRRNLHRDLCVLRISPEVMDIRGAVVTDQNASSNYAAFYPSPEGLRRVNQELVFSEFWTNPDQIEEWRHKSIKCTEVLIPDRVDQGYIMGVYGSCEQSVNRLFQHGLTELPLAN